MQFFVLVFLLAFVLHTFRLRDERRRIALLASHLGQFQIEKQMETLTDGYLRALGEDSLERREQIWNLLGNTESALCEQFQRFVLEFAKVDAALTRVSKLPFSIFYTGAWLPNTTFDLRKALAIHAHGLQLVLDNAQGRSIKERAFTVCAELFLMQHTCHWYCKSKTVASARVLLRHQTPYAKVLESVSPQTRQAYQALIAR